MPQTVISKEQVDFYKSEGYLIVERLFSEAEIRELKEVLNEFLERGKMMTESDGVVELEDTHTPEQPRIRRIIRPDDQHLVFRDFVRKPKYVQVVSPLIGPNIRLHFAKINLKMAGFGAPVQWHQDWAFYPHSNDDVLVSGVLIDDIVKDNGALMVFPGSHKGPVFDHHNAGRFSGAINLETSGLNFTNAVKLTAPSGSLVLFSARIVHGSDINRSQRSRRVLYYDLTAADAWPLCGTYTKPLIPNLETYNARMIAGNPTVEPRLEKVPVRIPLPPPDGSTGIYEAQKGAAKHFFEVEPDKQS